MAYVVKTDVADDYLGIATVTAALITASTITTFHQVHVLKDGSSRYIITLIYEGT